MTCACVVRGALPVHSPWTREHLMKKIPIQCSCDNGVLSAPVAVSLSAGAGLRSLPGSTPQPPRRRTTSVRIRRSISSLVHSTPAQLLVENAVLSALVERKAPSLLASAVSLVFGLVPPGLPPFETWFENDVAVCHRSEDVVGPSAGGPELLSPTHHRVLILTANGRILRFPLENPHGSTPVESPSPIPGPRHPALIERQVLTELCPRPEAPGIPSLLLLVRPDRSDPGHDSPPA